MKKFNAKKIFVGLSSTALIAASVPTVAAVTVNAAETSANVLYGDANVDGKVSISDAVAILQSIANSNKYGLNEQGSNNADVYQRGDGVTGNDAASIQRYDAQVITELPESWLGGKPSDPSDTDPQTDITYIHLSGSSISVEGDYAEVNGSTVTISHSGTFYVDGTLDDGQINVNVPDETADPETVKIFLNGVNITGKSAPAILVTNAENTSINLVDGTVNTISDGDTAYVGADGAASGEAVIEAKDDLTIKGGTENTGVLNLTANTQDGIASNNDIKLTGGTINVTTLNATDETDGIKGKSSVTVKENAIVNVEAEGDGIKASSTADNGYVSIEGGSVTIKAGNDAIQSATAINISGGTVVAGGDRGLTSVTGTNITGGTVIATATDNQIDSTLLKSENQATMLLNCIADSTSKDGTWKKANSISVGNVNASFTKKYAYVLISDASITAGKSYNLTNTGTGAAVTYDNDASDSFTVKNSVTTFENVNPAGKIDGETVTPTPSTDGATLTLSGASIASDAPADAVTVKDGVATITKEGSYTVTGDASDVQIVVDVDSSAYPESVVELNLVNANISNSTTAPIYVKSIGDEVQIVAKAGTTNTISDGTSHTETYTDSDGNTNTVEGAIFARDDIKFKGTGSLTVNGNEADAIVCKNDIKIYNGNITVNAVDDGIRGKDSVTVGNDSKSDGSAVDYSTLNLTVKTQQGDGIKSTATDTATDKSYGLVTINGGTIDINSYADGISAEQDFVMNGGDLNIYTYQGSGFTGSASGGTWYAPGGPGSSGGNQPGGMGQDGNSNKVDISAKGIKAVGLYDESGTTYQSAGNLTINGGNITIDSSDDSLHCAGDMAVLGGTLTLSSADDGMHSDNKLTIGQGSADTFDDVQIYIPKCYEGVEGVYIYQNSGSVYIVSGDDGYNAAGGADGSGSGNNMGWGGGGMSSTFGELNLNGGFVVVNSANGDHDALDSNGNINITGGYYLANGQEPLDCGDGGYSINKTGGNYATMTAGNTNLNTRYTFKDSSGNVIVSFVAQSGNPSANLSSGVSFTTGGNVSGGTAILTQSGLETYIGGTISGDSAVSGSGSGSQQPGFGW